MEIKPTNTEKITTNEIQVSTAEAQEKLNHLSDQIGAYYNRFTDLFSSPKALQIHDFVSLKLLGHDLEVKAQQTQTAILALEAIDPTKAQEIKNDYDSLFAYLHEQMKNLIDQVLPELKKEIDDKFKAISESQSFNPAAMGELNKMIQQFKMLVLHIEEEIKRVQSQRVFEL